MWNFGNEHPFILMLILFAFFNTIASVCNSLFKKHFVSCECCTHELEEKDIED